MLKNVVIGTLSILLVFMIFLYLKEKHANSGVSI